MICSFKCRPPKFTQYMTNGALEGSSSPGAPPYCFLQRLQVLDQIALPLRLQPEAEEAVVVIDNITQRRKAAVVEEAALLMRPQSGKRGGTVHVRRRSIGLKRVDADLAGRM